MLIKVINWCNHTILRKDTEPTFYLEKDNWNDNYFKTRYHLHLSPKATDDGEPVWIGEVKILKKGQRKEDHALVDTGKLEFLDYRYCSIGQSLDYYERISRLDKDLRYRILSALRDIIIFPEIKKEFDHEEGLEVSLLHFLDKNDDIFSLAPLLVSGDLDNVPVQDLTFHFQLPAMREPIRFEFDSLEYGFQDPSVVPNRVCVLTGATASGKTELLMKLAQIAFASPEQRDLLQDVGALEPAGLAFTKIICLSYSTKDSFQVPGVYLHEKQQLSSEVNKGIGRFAFCGVRDLSSEFEESLQFFTIDTDGRIWGYTRPDDMPKTTFLKPSENVLSEFKKSIEAIEEDQPKQDLLEDAFGILQEDSDLQFIRDIAFTNLTDDALDAFFMNLTADHQILFHALTSLILKIAPRSLVLFDEPEAGFTPSLRAVFMKVIKHVLDRENAFMIVATQATEIVQETPIKNISILIREGDLIKVLPFDIEKMEKPDQESPTPILGLTPDVHPFSSFD